MQVKVLGPVSKQVDILTQNTAIALKKLKIKAEFEKVSELKRVFAYGIIALPALIIDGKLISSGSVLTVEEAMVAIQRLS